MAGKLISPAAIAITLVALALVCLLPATASATSGEISKAVALPGWTRADIDASFMLDTDCSSDGSNPDRTCFYRVWLEIGDSIGCDTDLDQPGPAITSDGTVLWDPYSGLNDGEGVQFQGGSEPALTSGISLSRVAIPQGAEYAALCLTRVSHNRGIRGFYASRLAWLALEPPPPPPIGAKAAATLSKDALHRQFKWRWSEGARKQIDCSLTKSKVKYRCAVSWKYKKTIFKGDTVVPASPDSTAPVKINVKAKR